MKILATVFHFKNAPHPQILLNNAICLTSHAIPSTQIALYDMKPGETTPPNILVSFSFKNCYSIHLLPLKRLLRFQESTPFLGLAHTHDPTLETLRHLYDVLACEMRQSKLLIRSYRAIREPFYYPYWTNYHNIQAILFEPLFERLWVGQETYMLWWGTQKCLLKPSLSFHFTFSQLKQTTYYPFIIDPNEHSFLDNPSPQVIHDCPNSKTWECHFGTRLAFDAFLFPDKTWNLPLRFSSGMDNLVSFLSPNHTTHFSWSLTSDILSTFSSKTCSLHRHAQKRSKQMPLQFVTVWQKSSKPFHPCLYQAIESNKKREPVL